MSVGINLFILGDRKDRIEPKKGLNTLLHPDSDFRIRPKKVFRCLLDRDNYLDHDAVVSRS